MLGRIGCSFLTASQWTKRAPGAIETLFRAAYDGTMQEFTRAELRTLGSLDTPVKIQKYLDRIDYNHADTAFSPRLVLRHGRAHCLEGAALAAAALRVQGRAPLILDLEAVQDTDHVLAVFQERGAWGAIARSNFSGLRYRPPVYRTLRELAQSYLPNYVNFRGERTLRTFSRAVNLRRFDRQNWMTCDTDIWFIAEYLCEIPHTRLMTPQMERALTRVDARDLAAAMWGMQKK
jgi:hypothetical protein